MQTPRIPSRRSLYELRLSATHACHLHPPLPYYHSYPSIPFPRGAPYNGNWSAPPQFPSVSLLSWGGAFGNPGDGTARYWMLKLLNDEMRSGPPSGPYAPADADVLVSTTVSGGGAPLSSPFCADVLNLATMSMYCATGVINAITFASYGTPTGSCGSWAVGSCNAPNSTSIVESYCLGKASCTFNADTPTFGDVRWGWGGGRGWGGIGVCVGGGSVAAEGSQLRC